MSKYRKQAINDVAELVVITSRTMGIALSGKATFTQESSQKLLEYSVAQRERVLRLEANFEKLKWAAMHVIEMNKQQAIDQYGNILEAESWACVRTLRAALSEAI